MAPSRTSVRSSSRVSFCPCASGPAVEEPTPGYLEAVRLYDAEGINEGDTLYVINDKNLVTAKMTVRTLFNSISFGPMLVGYGNFRLRSVGDRVVQRTEEE